VSLKEVRRRQLELVIALLNALSREPLKGKYDKVIEPIILDLSRCGDEELIDRFVYTIIDQRRPVETCVIPAWFTFLRTGISASTLRESREARDLLEEVCAALLYEYGHELLWLSEEVKTFKRELPQASGGRSSAWASAYVKLATDPRYAGFKSFIERERATFVKNEARARKFLKEFKMIGFKSLLFFLRDLKPVPTALEEVPLPIDVNTMLSMQLTGVYFSEEEAKAIFLEEAVTEELVASKAKLAQKHYEISEHLKKRLAELVSAAGKPGTEAVVELSRGLFLVGALFCNKLREDWPRVCKFCPLSRHCLGYELFLKRPSAAQKLLSLIRRA